MGCLNEDFKKLYPHFIIQYTSITVSRSALRLLLIKCLLNTATWFSLRRYLLVITSSLQQEIQSIFVDCEISSKKNVVLTAFSYQDNT
jgi:low temperature requirement protein LtrA